MDETLAYRTARRPATLIAIALAALVVSFSLHVAVLVAIDSPVDFYVYFMAGHLLAGDPGPYEVSDGEWDALAGRLGIERYTRPYRYPPYTAAIGRALEPLGPRPAAAVWEVAGALGFIAGAWLLGSGLGGGRRLALSLALMLVWAPAYHTLMDGQVGGLVFFFLAFATWGLLRGNDVVAGFATAVAAALKLTPVALIVYFAWRRRWRVLACAIGGLVIVTLAALPLAPPRYFADYSSHAYALTDPQRINLSPQNQSFTAVAGRLLLDHTTWETTGRAAAVHSLALVFAAALAGITALVTWPRRPGADRARDSAGIRKDAGAGRRADLDALGFGMVIAATLVVGTFTYFHQFSWLFVPLMLVADRLIAGRRWRWLGGLALFVVLIDLNEGVWLTLRERLIDTPVWRVFDAPFLLALTLWALSGWLLWRSKGERGADSASDAEGGSTAVRIAAG